MSLAPLEDRIAFFRAQTAAIAFSMACDAAKFIAETSLTKSDSIHDPLVTSMVIHYGRPFKQRRPLRLPDSIVPEIDLGFHKALLEIRDKVVAHTDVDGPLAQDGYLINELAGYTRSDATHFGITIITPDLGRFISLTESLSRTLTEEAQRVWVKYFSSVRVPDGTTIVNLEEGNQPFLVPHPFL